MHKVKKPITKATFTRLLLPKRVLLKNARCRKYRRMAESSEEFSVKLVKAYTGKNSMSDAKKKI